jgi:large subunit ribosomal protein L22
MSKQKTERKLKDNEAQAFASVVQTTPRKLNLVALTFSKKRAAGDVKKVLQAAIANAENNHQLDVDRLVVAEAYVGGSFKLKRFHARAKGRGVRVEKKWSNLTVVVREQAEAAEETK